VVFELNQIGSRRRQNRRLQIKITYHLFHFKIMVLDTHMLKTALKIETTLITTTSTLTNSNETSSGIDYYFGPIEQMDQLGKMFWGSSSSDNAAQTPQKQQSTILAATKTNTTSTTTTTVTRAQNTSKTSTLNPIQEFVDNHRLLIGDKDEELVSLNIQHSSSKSATNLLSSLDDIEKTLLDDDNVHIITFEKDPQLSNSSGKSTTIILKK